MYPSFQEDIKWSGLGADTVPLYLRSQYPERRDGTSLMGTSVLMYVTGDLSVAALALMHLYEWICMNVRRYICVCMCLYSCSIACIREYNDCICVAVDPCVCTFTWYCGHGCVSGCVFMCGFVC